MAEASNTETSRLDGPWHLKTGKNTVKMKRIEIDIFHFPANLKTLNWRCFPAVSSSRGAKLCGTQMEGVCDLRGRVCIFSGYRQRRKLFQSESLVTVIQYN